MFFVWFDTVISEVTCLWQVDVAKIFGSGMEGTRGGGR